MQRDYMVDEMIKYYDLGRIRLASETIETSSGLASTPQHLMKMAKEEIEAVVVREEDAINRIFALYMAMDMLGYCTMSPHQEVTDGSGQVIATTGGPLTYLKELEKRRHENPGLRFLMIYDRKVRKTIFDLQCEDKDLYSDYSFTMFVVLRDHKHLLQEARNECAVPSLDIALSGVPASSPSASSSSVVIPTVINVPADTSQAPRGMQPAQRYVDQNGNPVSAKRARRIMAGGANSGNPVPVLSPPTVVQVAPNGGGNGGSNKTPTGSRQKVPENEWKKICAVSKKTKVKGACLFWNTSMGCHNASCVKHHDVCIECGNNHRWVDVHFRK